VGVVSRWAVALPHRPVAQYLPMLAAQMRADSGIYEGLSVSTLSTTSRA